LVSIAAAVECVGTGAAADLGLAAEAFGDDQDNIEAAVEAGGGGSIYMTGKD